METLYLTYLKLIIRNYYAREMEQQDTKISDPTVMANELSKYFSNNGTGRSRLVPHTDGDFKDFLEQLNSKNPLQDTITSQ